MTEVLTSGSGHLQVTSVRAKEAQDFDARLIRDAERVDAVLVGELPGVRLRRVLEVPALVGGETPSRGGVAVGGGRADDLGRRLAADPGGGVVVGEPAGVRLRRVLEVPALVSGETRSRGAVVVGVAQADELGRRFADDHVVSGRLPAPGSWDEIALGEALATALQVEPGDPVYVFAPGTEGWGAAAYTLVGLLSFPQTSYGIQAAYLSLEGAQLLAAPDAVTRLEVHLAPERGVVTDAMIEEARDRLAAALGPDVRVETWWEAAPYMAALPPIVHPAMAVFSCFISILAGLLVVNTFSVGRVEVIREFGVIIAVGADRWRVMRMVLAESLVLVLAGAAAGLMVSGLL